jgi:hypothetical protein
LADNYVVTHLPSGKSITRFGGGAGKRATARTFCAAINDLIDWRDADPKRLAAMLRSPSGCTGSRHF